MLSVATQNLRGLMSPESIRVVEVQPGMHNTQLDKAIWTSDSDEREVNAAQVMYNAYKELFGSDPVNVGEIIRDIVVGDIDEACVVVGKDAKMSVWLHNHLPGWRETFRFMFTCVMQVFKPVVARIEEDGFDEQMKKVLAYYTPIFKLLGLHG